MSDRIQCLAMQKLCVILPDEVNDTGEAEDQEKIKETVPVHDVSSASCNCDSSVILLLCS